jgi:TonB-dependent starch-binding outer membrane protein SusC
MSLLKEPQIGTITDVDGKFIINVPQGSTILVFSFIGFESMQMQMLPEKKLLRLN